MTRPRSEIIDRENGGFYHLGGRCVRRAMLCGPDPVTGLDLSHRRGWIEELMLRFAALFTVHVVEYAVMSNHYHLVVDYRPKDRFELGDEEVARRWLRIYPPRDPDDLEARVAGLLDDPERLAVLRDRLGDLSWYMSRLNETVARMANLEDGCTGKFWQGRFASKDLPDERSVWACMAYDALNPVRAGMADRVDAPEHTGLQRRLEEAEEEPERLDEPLAPLVVRDRRVATARPPAPTLELTLREYRAHVEWTGGMLRDDVPQGRAPPELGDAKSWLKLVRSFRRRVVRQSVPRWVPALA